MPSEVSRPLQRARSWLSSEAEAPHTSAEVAATVERLSAQLTARLGRVIGEAGVAAIAARSIHKLRASLPSLRRSVVSTAPSERSTALSELLLELEPAQALHAAESVFATFIDVLISVIGETLAWRLLSDIEPVTAADAPTNSEGPHDGVSKGHA